MSVFFLMLAICRHFLSNLHVKVAVTTAVGLSIRG